VILKFSYQLRRHLWAEWPLSRWVGALLLAAVLGSLLIHWLRPWAAVLIGLLYLGYILVLGWASRRAYIHYEALSEVEALHQNSPEAPPLRPEELVPVRVSGWFSVEGKDQYYVDLEADFETVATREHIILGRVHPSRFLYLGNWAVDQLGWWYIFFQPAMIREMGMGLLYYGAEAQQVLRLIYAPDAETEQTIYVRFKDDIALRRVWKDLLLDSAPEIVAPVGTGADSGAGETGRLGQSR
jgi:hypothetical protein